MQKEVENDMETGIKRDVRGISHTRIPIMEYTRDCTEGTPMSTV